jgi:hypothetical protein
MRKLLALLALLFAAACGSSSTDGGAAAPSQTAAPTFSPPAGTFDAALSVTITSATAGAAIYYTTDGVDPTTASSVYSTPVPVSTTTTLKAIATAPGHIQSTVASATYTIGAGAPAPAPPAPAACTLASAVPTCSSCHGNPPPPPHQQTVTTCASCHGPVNNGSGTPSTGMTAAASGTSCVLQYPLSGTHNNGTVNFGAAQ